MGTLANGFHVEDADGWRQVADLWELGLTVNTFGSWATATLTLPDTVASLVGPAVIEDCDRNAYTLGSLDSLLADYRSIQAEPIGLCPADADRIRRERVTEACRRAYALTVAASGTLSKADALALCSVDGFQFDRTLKQRAGKQVPYPFECAAMLSMDVRDGTLWHYGLGETALLVSALRVAGYSESYGQPTDHGRLVSALQSYALRLELPVRATGD